MTDKIDPPRNKNGNTETDVDVYTKYLKDQKNQTKTFKNKNNITNLYKTYENQGACLAGTTNNISDLKYAIFKNRCDQSKLKKDDRREIFLIILTGSAKYFAT